MYKKGEEKLEKEMNFDRLLRKVKEMHATLKHHVWTEEIRF